MIGIVELYFKHVLTFEVLNMQRMRRKIFSGALGNGIGENNGAAVPREIREPTLSRNVPRRTFTHLERNLSTLVNRRTEGRIEERCVVVSVCRRPRIDIVIGSSGDCAAFAEIDRKRTSVAGEEVSVNVESRIAILGRDGHYASIGGENIP